MFVLGIVHEEKKHRAFCVTKVWAYYLALPGILTSKLLLFNFFFFYLG